MRLKPHLLRSKEAVDVSVQSKIDGIVAAKAAIKAAIEGKGVVVPGATLLSGMAALIDGIEAGANVTAGTITVTSDTNDFTLTHGLGEIPAFFAIGMSSSIPKGKTYILIGGFGFGYINMQCRVSASSSEYAPSGKLDEKGITSQVSKISFSGATAQTINVADSSGHMKLVSGTTYYWIATGSEVF